MDRQLVAVFVQRQGVSFDVRLDGGVSCVRLVLKIGHFQVEHGHIPDEEDQEQGEDDTRSHR